MRAVAFGLAVLLAASASAAPLPRPDRPHRPDLPFEESAAPPAPDYASPEAWLAMPDRLGAAGALPAGVRPPDGDPPADVFFVLPTTLLSGAAWNARADEPGRPAELAELVLRNQAGAFRACCRIFAPRYRAAGIGFVAAGLDEGGAAALDLAYGDVRRAFEAYMAGPNGGRPFVLAGHGQGSIHVIRLLQEAVLGTARQKRLVAAYAVGAALPTDIESKGLPVCRDPLGTGCVITWNTVKAVGDGRRGGRFPVWLDGRYQPIGNRPRVCVNPLTWTADGDAPLSANLGALPGVGLAAPLPALVPALAGATCEDGRLVAKLPLTRHEGFEDALTLLGGYHVYDYNLFYMNIRRNAAARVAAYLSAPH